LKVFVIILGQCNLVVKSKLENHKGFEQLELDDHVVGLLGMLKQMVFSAAGVAMLYDSNQPGTKQIGGQLLQKNQCEYQSDGVTVVNVPSYHGTHWR
jgi:hypothetical protein